MRSLSATALTVTFIGIVSISEAQTGWSGTVTTISAPSSSLGEFAIALAVEPNGNADSTLTLTWNPPVLGTAVTSYVIQASGAVTGSLPTLTRSFSATVGSGTYTLSVVAANECGTSAPSEVVTVTVP